MSNKVIDALYERLGYLGNDLVDMAKANAYLECITLIQEEMLEKIKAENKEFEFRDPDSNGLD